jgi:hypothetical protein
VTLDAATVLLQWATGGLAFTWVTTRRREVGLGYGWLNRSVYGGLAVLAVVAGRTLSPDGWGATLRDVAGAAVAGAALVALAVSVARRRAGVSGQDARRRQRAARVAAMVAGGAGMGDEGGASPATSPPEGVQRQGALREFSPALDLVAPVLGVVGLVGAASVAGGAYGLALARLVIGAAFLGAVTDAMLLGHWYLVQPGLSRGPLREMNGWLAVLWPFEVGALLWSPGMPQVLSGTIDDGWDGLLGWTWLTSAVTTIGLVGVVHLALRERYYSAVMAATGLLYLAILTAFGTDLVARAVLAP